MPTSKRADLSKVLPAVKCTARKRNGEPCKAMAARGANVCRVHGGSAPQVKKAARRRLDNAADALTARLLGFALDNGVPDAIALAAIRDALDRAGMSAKTAVEVEVSAKPWEQVMNGFADRIQTTSRDDWRRAQGMEVEQTSVSAFDLTAELGAINPTSLDEADDDEVIDAEVVDVSGHPDPTPLVDEERARAQPTAPGMGTRGGLVTAADGAAQAAELRRRAAIVPARRALPPGRSR